MRLVVFVLAVALAMSSPGSIRAEEPNPKTDPPRDPFVLDWWSVDGGGGPAAGGSFELLATLGQPDAGAAVGGEYVLQGGFLGGGDPGLIFADGFEGGTTDAWFGTVGSRRPRGGER